METLGGRKSVVTDAVCLALVTFVSAAPYITKLGFYSDDWWLLETFSSSRTSLGAVLEDFSVRPLQGIYAAALFRVFGLAPLGYHLVNTAMIALAVVLLYLLLLRLRFSRSEALGVSLLFLMLPQLSTIRVWYSTVQVPLSMALALLSMHAQISYARCGELLGGRLQLSRRCYRSRHTKFSRRWWQFFRSFCFSREGNCFPKRRNRTAG